MKKIILSVLVLLSAITCVNAQKVTDIQFSYFVKATQDDTNAAEVVDVNGYKGKLMLNSWVSENPATKAQIIKLLNNLKRNGTEDINKCFIPRHAVTVYNNDSVLYQVLVCFECDGIRFSNQRISSKIKSVNKREKWMKELKTLFVNAHFKTEGN